LGCEQPHEGVAVAGHGDHGVAGGFEQRCQSLPKKVRVFGYRYGQGMRIRAVSGVAVFGVPACVATST
jgi:hypothetical protein